MENQIVHPKLVSLLPSQISYEAYYQLQRRFGRLKKPNPVNKFKIAIETWEKILDLSIVPQNKVFFEIVPGRSPLVPIAYWMMGATKTITIDLNFT